jgi:hypothetical protein
MYLALAQHLSPLTDLALPHYTAPLYIAIPVIVVVVLVKVVVTKRRGLPAVGGEISVRCGKGHVFQTFWSPWGSFKAIRLGAARFQRCPVGDHWSLVRPVD